jgi:hypothetical protein
MICTSAHIDAGNAIGSLDHFSLQVRQHAHAAVDVLRGYGDDFLADAMKFQIDAHVAYGQIADAQ